MYPEFYLTLFGWQFMLHSSGIFYALGLLIGILVWYYLAQKAHLPADKVFDFALGLIIFGFLGARILYIFEFKNEFLSISQMFKVWQGGFVWYGGFIAGLLYLLAHLYWKHKREIKLFLITAIPCLIIGQAIGRIGCFLNGDSFGLPSNLPWAMPVKSLADGVYRHPTQLYEFLAYVIIFLFSFRYLQKTKFSSRVGMISLVVYFLARFLIEFLRFHTPGEMFFGVISNSQLISLIFICLIVYLYKPNLFKQPKFGNLSLKR